MKIKVIMPGQPDSHMAWRMHTMCIWEENYDPEYTITDKDDYDFLVVCNKLNERPRVPKNQVIGVIMEPAWNCQWDKNLDKIAGTIFVHNNSLFGFSPEQTHIIETPSLMFTEFYNSQEKINYFIQTDFFKEKSERLNIIISGTNRPGKNLYTQRRDLVQNVLKSKLPINVYGRFWQSNNDRLKGGFKKKLDIIKKAEFSVCIENCSEKNYISEKFFDPILVDCVPIYYGCPNIKEIYDEKSFIELNLSNPSKYLELFDNILKYGKNSDYINSLKAMKLKHFREHNLYTEVVKRIKKL